MCHLQSLCYNIAVMHACVSRQQNTVVPWPGLEESDISNVCVCVCHSQSLCYNIAVMEALVADPEACAIYIFPTKALAQVCV